MAQSLRFTVEVAADQATGALNAMSAAFNQAGINARSSLLAVGSASKQATSSISSFKEGLSRSRESAMFFTQSLREFGPAGATAQIALSGIAGAMLGGGGVILALEGARVGLRLLMQAINEGTQAAKDAAKEHQAAGEKIRDAYSKATDSVRVLIAEMRGGKVAAAEMSAAIALEGVQDGIRKAEEALARARKAQDEYNRAWVRTDEGLQLHAENVKTAEQNLAAAQGLAGRVGQEEALKLNKAYEQFHEEERKRIKETSDARTKAQRDAFEAARKAHQSKLQLDEGLDLAGQEAWSAEQDKEREFLEWKKQFNREVNEWVAEDERKELAKRTQAYAAFGQQIGSTIASALTSGMTPLQAMGAIMKDVMRQVIQMAITNVTAKAADAAAGAAASQSAVPVVGPALGVAAMTAMLSAVMGLLGSIPSAAGGMKVPRDTLALIHKDEHVIPARIAREYEAGLGGGGGDVNFNIVTPDAQGVGRMLRNAESELSKELRRMQRKRRG